MIAEIEDNEQNHNKAHNVTPVGDAWVICNSKTRPGFKYYFNTLTGRAVWNLSPDEIEKAKMFTNALSINEIEKCPEPNDPPINIIQPNQSQVYNKQIVNNQFPNQPLNIFPVSMMNSVPGSGGLNQHMWPPNNAGIPQGQVLFVAFPQSIQHAVMQSPPECLQNSQFTNSYNQFCHSQDSEKNSQSSRFQGNAANKEKKRFNNWGKKRFSQQNTQHTQNWKGKSPDLRQKLIRKRIINLTECEPDSYKGIVRKQKEVQAKPKAPVYCNMPVESPSKYDLTALKGLKAPYSHSDHWFIVTDTEIILNNFPFLNKITDPDENCYIMVPDHVMKELQENAYKGNDVRTRRIYRFLSEQIESEFAFRGDEILELANDVDKTFATCEHLAMRNNVILLSNNIRLNKYKGINENIHVLTMAELEMTLKKKPIEQETTRRSSPTLAIKIIVPNDVHPQTNGDCPSRRMRAQTPGLEVSPRIVNSQENNSMSETTPSSKLIVNTETQASGSLYHVNEIGPNTVPCDTPASAGFNRGSENSSSTTNVVPSKMTLSHTFPNQKPNNEENTQKKQYRWRKRREIPNKLLNVSKSTPEIREMAVGNKVEGNKAATFNTCRNSESNITEPLLKPLFSPQTNSSDRSSISSSFKKLGHPNIVIEETSTSVISNTNDSESINGNSQLKDKKVIRMCNYVLFEIAGQSMEEVLKTRREEWVLRFVQIMEEVLRVKLRENTQNKVYAESWATDLPELTRCIIKKYSDYFNVVDAANKLSFTLYRLCDNKGNVTPSIEPPQYMDMYSYGVYLIEALKDVAHDCEDLNIASDSLKKLLYDIQNINLDSSHNDTFVDELHEVANISESIGVNNILPQPKVASTKETTEDDLSDDQNNKTPYRLRARKKKPTKINNEQQPKFPWNHEAKFFSSLELEKRDLVKSFVFQNTADDAPKSANVLNKPAKVQLSPKILQTPKHLQSPTTPPSSTVPQSPKLQQSPRDPRSPRTPQLSRTPLGSPVKQIELHTPLMQDLPNSNYSGTGERITTTAAVAPVVVRNFTSLPEFEHRLSGRFGSNKDEEEEEDEEEYLYEDYDENELEDHELTHESEKEGIPKNERNLDENGTENAKRFRSLVGDFVGEIRDTFVCVNKLCDEFEQCYKNRKFKPDMDTKMRDASVTLLKICASLNRILDREKTKPDSNIMILLKKAKLDDYVANEDLRLEYIEVVTKSRNKASDIYKYVIFLMKKAGIK